jgi:hypothetical protein
MIHNRRPEASNPPSATPTIQPLPIPIDHIAQHPTELHHSGEGRFPPDTSKGCGKMHSNVSQKSRFRCTPTTISHRNSFSVVRVTLHFFLFADPSSPTRSVLEYIRYRSLPWVHTPLTPPYHRTSWAITRAAVASTSITGSF